MTKYKTVSEFLANLAPDRKNQVELLRSYIFQAEPTLTENIKWNAPNYIFEDIDRITFNVHNKEQAVRILIHKGVIEKEDKKAMPIMEDTSGLIKWNSNIRGTLSFNTIQEIENHAKEIKNIISDWLKL